MVAGYLQNNAHEKCQIGVDQLSVWTYNHYMFNSSTKERNMQQTTQQQQNSKPATPAREGYEWVKNLMTGQWVEQPVDTPWCCRVDSERYWSM